MTTNPPAKVVRITNELQSDDIKLRKSASSLLKDIQKREMAKDAMKDMDLGGGTIGNLVKTVSFDVYFFVRPKTLKGQRALVVKSRSTPELVVISGTRGSEASLD